jgi:hypothetical protein
MLKNTISVIVALFVLLVANSAIASDIRIYDVKDVVKAPNIHNMKHGVKQRVELEAKLLQWNLTEPLRAITRMPHHALQSIPTINHAPTAPQAPTLEQKVAEWKAIECQRFNRCE